MNILIRDKRIQLLAGLLLASGIIVVKGISGPDILMWRTVALTVLMVYLWLLEVIPIYVTALLPLAMSSVLGILTPKDLALAYGDTNIYLFLGGFILALGLEKHRIHLQISQRIIRIVGNTKSRLLLAVILSTGIISMWISNTATALMMLPIGMAILKARPEHERQSRFGVLLVLSIAYAASIGGAGTLIGSPPNLIMAALVNQAPYHANIDFVSWAIVGIPFSLIFLFILFMVFRLRLGKEGTEKIELDNLTVEPWSANQLRVVTIFSVVVLLWLTKDISAALFHFSYTDVFPSMLGAVLLFIIPRANKRKPLLSWKSVRNIPWGILLLFGGGIAVASALQKHGVIALIADSFSLFTTLPIVVILLIVVTISVFTTELVSNTALTNILVPIVVAFALASHLSVAQLSIAVTLGASWAFMLPVGTPPNAIAFASGAVTMKDMIRNGLILNIISVILITVLTSLFL